MMPHTESDYFTLQADDSGNSQGQIDNMNVVETEEETVKPKKEQLSYRTLVLHRGLVLALMLFILAFGIILNLVVTNMIT